MSKQWHGGKGSAPRKSNDQKQYAHNWDKIFGNADQKQKQVQETVESVAKVAQESVEGDENENKDV